jgi:hypothetical protein
MNDRAKLAVGIILAGLALGALGDALLRVGPWGLNTFLWTGLLVGGTILLVLRHRAVVERRAAWLIPPTLAAAAGLAWRDSGALKLLDVGALCGLLALALWQARGTRIAVAGVVEGGWRFLKAGFNVAAGYVPLFLAPVQWPQPASAGWAKNARAVTIGVLLASPLLVVFGALLMAADAVFNRLVSDLIRIDLANLLSHFMLTAFFAWVVVGYLQGLLFAERNGEGRLAVPQFCSLGALEVGIALGLLNLLFAAFVVVQIRYLFGGAHLVQVTPGLTYAEYARRGFFELVAVVLLALPVLLLADWLLGSGPKRAFRAQAGVMVLMLGVILASAFHRMRLYQSEYGWTELRLYVTACMAWLAIVLLWFVATVLRGLRERFTFGALAAGYALVVALHVVNPDAFIVRRNLAHAKAGHRFDAAYAASLSADAFPALAAALPELQPADSAVIWERFSAWQSRTPPDWRTWSWSRAQARRAVEPHVGAGNRQPSASQTPIPLARGQIR